MKGIEVTRTVKLSLTREDWCLFDKPGACAAADGMNLKLQRLVNAGLNRTEITRAMYDFTEMYAAYGACDTEPTEVLEKVLDTIFG